MGKIIREVISIPSIIVDTDNNRAKYSKQIFEQLQEIEPGYDVLCKFNTLDVTVVAEAINAIYKANKIFGTTDQLNLKGL
jgi:hypothetical protein